MFQIDYWQELKELSAFLHAATGSYLTYREWQHKNGYWSTEIFFKGLSITTVTELDREDAFQVAVEYMQKLPIVLLKDIASLPLRTRK